MAGRILKQPKRRSLFRPRYILVFLVVLIAVAFMTASRSIADTDDAISQNSPKPGSSDVIGMSGSQTPWNAVGTGAFNGHWSWVKVYVPASVNHSVDVNIKQACNLDVGSPRVEYYLNDMSNGDNLKDDNTSQTETYQTGNTYGKTVDENEHGNNNGNCRNNEFTLGTIHTNQGTVSNVPGHTKYKVFMIVAHITNTDVNNDNERSFRVSSENGVLIGTARPISDGHYYKDNLDLRTAFTSVYQRDAGANPPASPGVYNGPNSTWDYELEVAPTCNQTLGDTSEIQIFDADKGVYTPQNLGVRITESPRSSNPSWRTIVDKDQGWFKPGTGQTDVLKFPADVDHMYKIHITGMNWRNTVQIRVPFDQVDAHPLGDGVGGTCTHPGGTITKAFCQNPSLTLNAYVDNDGGSEVKFKVNRLKTLGDHNGGTMPVIDRTTRQNGHTTVNYPANATLKDAYDSHSPVELLLYVLYPVGSTDPDLAANAGKDSNGTWVKVSDQKISPEDGPPCTPDQPSSQCNYLTVPRPLDYGNSPHTAKTDYKVTDARGIVMVSGSIYSLHHDANSPTEVKRGPYYPTTSRVNVNIHTTWYGTDGAWHEESSSTNGYTASPADKNLYCYGPRCNISVNSALGDDKLISGQSFTISGSITNLDIDWANTYNGYGKQETAIPGQVTQNGVNKLSLTINGQQHTPPNVFGIAKGGTVDITTFSGGNATADASGYQTITAYPDFYGLGAILDTNNQNPVCTRTFPVYNKFKVTEINPSSKLTPNSEAPTQATYSSSINLTETGGSRPIYIPTNTAFYYLPKGQPLTDGAGNPNGTMVNITDTSRDYGMGITPWAGGTYNVPSTFTAGDQYCTWSYAAYTDGYVGPGGTHDVIATAIIPPPKDPNYACDVVHNEPYVHFVGSDVSAGGKFGAASCTNPGSIKTYHTSNASPGKDRGSNAQFAALAIGDIEGFSSANLMNNLLNPNSSHTDLNFGNLGLNDAALGSVDDHKSSMGGHLNSVPHCVSDYFSKKPATSQPGGSTTVATADASKYFDGNVTIDGGTVASGSKTIYVDGDVTITNNITFSTAGGWTQPSDTPSLYIIAHGNINIAPNVTQLDGIYIAQPRDGSTGKINTCDFPIADIANFYDVCKKQLKVYGAFVADKVMLRRTHSSMRYSPAAGGESVFDATAHSCTATGSDVDSSEPTSSNDCAAEVFFFSPEFYLTNPGLTPIGGPSTGKYDSFTSLSPTL